MKGGKTLVNKMRIIIGLMVVCMAIIMLVSLTPTIQDLVSDWQARDSFNCNGYIDTNCDESTETCTTSQNQTYDANYQSNKLGCTITDLWVPFLVLGILVSFIVIIMYPEKQQQAIDIGYNQGY